MEKFISDFMQMTLDEIKIIVPDPYWAVGENSSHILSQDLLPEEDRFKIFYVETEKLVKNSDFREVDMSILFTQEDKNNRRISRILNHWKNHKPLDPPKIHFEPFNQKINFEDGRHRTKLSFYLGFEKIPVAIYSEDVDYVRNLFPLF